MSGCSRLRSLPNISRNIKSLHVLGSKITELTASIVGHWSRLQWLEIGCRSLKRLTHVPLSLTSLNLSNSDIKTIPDCVKGLPHLIYLQVENCTKLVSIPGLSRSLLSLNANNCLSLKTVRCSFHNSIWILMFYNCLALDEEARRGIIQQSVDMQTCLPGKQVPAEFTHQNTGNSISIPLAFSASSRFKACLLLLSIEDVSFLNITCRLRIKGGVEINTIHKFAEVSNQYPQSSSEHLFIFCGYLFHKQNRRLEVEVTTNEALFEFSCNGNSCKIIECGVQILREEAEEGMLSSEVGYSVTGVNRNHHTYGDKDYEGGAYKVSQVENIKNSKRISHWGWFRKLRMGKKNVKIIG